MLGAYRIGFITTILLIFGMIFSVTPILAAEDSPVGKDKYKLIVGGFFPAIDSQLKVENKGLGLGTDIDLESDLGFGEDVSLARIEGYWRFAPKHRLYLGYYGFSRDTTKTLEKDIEWDDKTFLLGAELASEWDIDFIYGRYGYSFFQGDKWELSGSIGLYYLKNTFSVRGEARLEGDGSEGEVVAEVSDEADVDVPIPLFGLAAEYYITPKWRAIASIGYFTISIDEWDGSVFDCSANLEYLFHKNFGIGAGYFYFDADVERDKTERISHLDYTYQGVQVYGILWF